MIYKPMLAHKIDDKRSSVIFPGYVQPKLDGVRCQLTEDGFFSRSGKKISGVPLLETLTMDTFGDIPLDGELYSPHMSFQEILSCVRRSKCINEKTEVQYHVYDLATNEPFVDRHLKLTAEFWGWHGKRIVLVPTHQVMRWYDVEQRMAVFVTQGYEGLIYRHPRATYQFGKRSKYLLKYKKMKTETVICVGHKEGKGKNKRRLGALECIDDSGTTVWVGSGFDDVERQAYWRIRDDLIGRSLTIRFQEKTDGGVSRFPVFVTWEDS